MIGIYKITSPSNRVYVGQSINIDKRLNEYRGLRNCKNQPKIYRSFLKYGVENHSFEIIEIITISELNKRERYWQEFYNTVEEGLNCCFTSTDTERMLFFKETIEKMKKSGIGKNKGRKYTDEERKAMSESKKGQTPVNKGKITYYKYKCFVCGKEGETRKASRKLCSLQCRDENNRICNAKRKGTKQIKRNDKTRNNKATLHNRVY